MLKSEEIREKAEKILRDSGLIEELAKYGEVHPIGSYRETGGGSGEKSDCRTDQAGSDCGREVFVRAVLQYGCVPRGAGPWHDVRGRDDTGVGEITTLRRNFHGAYTRVANPLLYF